MSRPPMMADRRPPGSARWARLALVPLGAFALHQTFSALAADGGMRRPCQTAWVAGGGWMRWRGPARRAAATAGHRQRRGLGRRSLEDSAGPQADNALNAEGPSPEADPIHKRLRVTALGGHRGSCLLEMGGQRILINPNLEKFPQLPPEKVHELVDYVVLTSAKKPFFDKPTIGKMNLAKTSFVACSEVGKELAKSLVRNLAILASGPGGCGVLEGEKGSAPVAVMVIPGAGSLPWETREVGFLFINTKTGIAVGYDALGQYLGPGASSNLPGIPEEAYQVDYLLTPDLRETTEVVKGLQAKGTLLRGVVSLPNPVPPPNPVVSALLAVDRTLDRVLGGAGDTPEDFQDFLRQQGSPLDQVRLFTPDLAGGPMDLD